MAYPNDNRNIDQDPNASERKKDHIDLAFKSIVSPSEIDTRFYYEPMLSGHPKDSNHIECQFDGKLLKAPLWVSSMTGGTAKAKTINENLAKACGEYKLGMGLGSCRQLLFSDEYLKDFQVRKWTNQQPLYANLGIAQIETLVNDKKLHLIIELIDKLDADGLIIHVNPMQEWLQPEGDRYYQSPVETIEKVLQSIDIKIIVKEVGQGFGPASLEALLRLPLIAVDFGASGGTNFALLEILRSSSPMFVENFKPLVQLGHSAQEMVVLANKINTKLATQRQCRQLIISGGIADFLDGYFLTEKSEIPAIYAQASGFLKYAMDSYEVLQQYVNAQINGLSLSKAFLKIKY